MPKYSLKKLVKGIFGIELYKFQEKFLYDCLNHPRVLGAWCRQTGKSMTLSIYACLEAMRLKNGRIVIVSHTDRQAGELFKKISDFIINSPLASEVVNRTMREVVLKNGTRISAYPTGDRGDNIRGLTANVLIEEEAAYIKDEIHNRVLAPMVAATQGRIIKISTPYGMNHFHRSYRNTKLWVVHHNTWREGVKVGLFTQEFIDEQREESVDMEFRTEYEAEFIADEDAYFEHAMLKRAVTNKDFFSEIQDGYRFRLDHPKSKLVLGVDFAAMGADETALVILEKPPFGSTDLNVVFAKTLKKMNQTKTIEIVRWLNAKMKFSKIYCDYTGIGVGVVDMLRSLLPAVVEGVTFTINSKMDMFSNLKLLLEKGQLKLPDNKKLLYQMMDLRYERIAGSKKMKIHHSARGHDDLPDALGLAALFFKPTRRGVFYVG